MPNYPTTEESLNRFLTTVTVELESFKRFMALYAPTLAPGFNAVDCLYPDENRLSAVIAMLLDPKGGHGQGGVFLNTFLKIVNPQNKPDESDSPSTPFNRLKNICNLDLSKARTKVQLEVATSYLEKENEYRRIDILLDLDGFGLAIENKPWAIDQPRQIADYHSNLRLKYGTNFILIYLSGNGNPPGTGSVTLEERKIMEATGHFFVMSYLHLKEWCQLCVEKCQAPRVRYFLEEFINYIKISFGGEADMKENEIVIDSILKNRDDPTRLTTTFLIAQSIDPIKKKLMNELLDSLDAKTKELTNGIEFHRDDDMWLKDAGFEWTKQGWNNFRIRFVFEYANASELLYGIARVNEGVPAVKNDFFKTELDTGGKFDPPFWYWWKHWDSPGWGNHNELWIEVYDGTLSRKIMGEVQRIVYTLDQLKTS